MAENKSYYYIRLKDNFFDEDAIQILESMPDGYLYSNILLKMYLRSLKYEGRLMYNERIPYNAQVLATLTRHSVGVVEKALQILRDLELIDILNNGAIYMIDIQNLIGKTTTEADRKRSYRLRIEDEKKLLSGAADNKQDKCPDNCPEIPDKNPLELRDKSLDLIDQRIEGEIEDTQDEPASSSPKPSKKKKEESVRHKYGEYKNVLLSDEDLEKLKNEIPDEWENYIERLSSYIADASLTEGTKAIMTASMDGYEPVSKTAATVISNAT